VEVTLVVAVAAAAPVGQPWLAQAALAQLDSFGDKVVHFHLQMQAI
jgi:hypothetical protein